MNSVWWLKIATYFHKVLQMINKKVNGVNIVSKAIIELK